MGVLFIWMGEWVTGVCYGPGVFGGLWFVSGMDFNILPIIGMLAFAALATSLLLSHQPPQIETDRLVGKKSFAVRYGKQRTCQVSVILYTIALLLIGIGIGISITTNHKDGYFLFATILLVMVSGLALLKVDPNPERVLLLSSSFLLINTIYLSLFTN